MADKTEKTEKKPDKKKKVAKPYKKGKSCPKCGAGTRLGEHANRFACGKCGYTEIK